jgi:23S rRNA (adenine2503-C2)-methyltransferase
MKDLAKENLPVTLCVSLHAPDDEIRAKIMPVAKKWKIAEILKACREYIGQTGRRVIFEYALSEGINASPRDAEKLAALLRGMQCHVNLIPLNPVKERGMAGVSEETVRRFMNVLKEKHISVTRRREMGDDIEGACGQLRRSVAQTRPASG